MSSVDARPVRLTSRMRWLLVLCGPMNVTGAVILAPPFSVGRALLGLPDSHPLYLWLLSTWVLAFGIAYAHQGLTGVADRGVLALGAVGKISFGGMVVGLMWSREARSIAAIAALPDLFVGALFLWWLTVGCQKAER